MQCPAIRLRPIAVACGYAILLPPQVCNCNALRRRRKQGKQGKQILGHGSMRDAGMHVGSPPAVTVGCGTVTTGHSFIHSIHISSVRAPWSRRQNPDGLQFCRVWPCQPFTPSLSSLPCPRHHRSARHRSNTRKEMKRAHSSNSIHPTGAQKPFPPELNIAS